MQKLPFYKATDVKLETTSWQGLEKCFCLWQPLKMQVDPKKFCLRPIPSATFNELVQAQLAPRKGPLSPLEGKEMKGSTLQVSLSAVLDKSSYEWSA